MNNNRKHKWIKLTRKDRAEMVRQSGPRKSTKAKVANRRM